MSSNTAISVVNVSKAFPIYAKPHHRLMQMISPPSAKSHWFKTFTALRDVSFDIERGETLGIIGRNGSGKSTLLQIICGTLAPSAGNVSVHGRVAALLELGAGFNPEFTGLENVYLNATVLGLTQREIDERLDSILAFADIGQFIDQPVKSYSSGMYIRLAFAVAINVTPDVLVVDEALSVGDEAFQRKCFARIQQMKEAGATILFVSHSASTVVELCDRAVLLDRGELLAIGKPKFAVSRYHKLLYAPIERADSVRQSIKNEALAEILALESSREHPDVESAQRGNSLLIPGEDYLDEGMVPRSTVRYSHRGAHIEDVRIEAEDGRRVNVLKRNARYDYVYRVRFDTAASRVRFGMMIKTTAGVELGGGVSQGASEARDEYPEGGVVDVSFSFRCALAPGVYFLNAGVMGFVEGQEHFLDRYLDVAMFRVLPESEMVMTGMVDFSTKSTIAIRSGGVS